MAYGYKFVTGSVTTVVSDDIAPAYPLATFTASFTGNTNTLQSFSFDTQGFTSFTYAYFCNGENMGRPYSGSERIIAIRPTITIGAGTLTCRWWGVVPNTSYNTNTMTIVVLGI